MFGKVFFFCFVFVLFLFLFVFFLNRNCENDYINKHFTFPDYSFLDFHLLFDVGILPFFGKKINQIVNQYLT